MGEFNFDTEEDCVGTYEDDCSEPPVDIGIEDVIRHEKYENHTLLNDIALIRLAEDVKTSDFIKFICLPTPEFQSEDGQNITIFGFGRQVYGDAKSLSSVKQKVHLPVHNLEKCIALYSSINMIVTPNQMCAGGNNIPGDACQGDSGGPLMKAMNQHWYLEGLISHGRGCGNKMFPGVYTRVTSYLEWIVESMKP